jgi:predicted O-methyltransferase YrrM
VSGDVARHPRLRKGIGQLVTRAAFRNLVQRPRFFLRNVRLAPRFYRDKLRVTGVEPFREHVRSEREALSAVVGASVAECERELERVWLPEPDPNEPLTGWNARAELLRMIGAIVKLAPVRVMVETGVALGFTTATALRAMHDTDEGHLYSIDLPAIQYDPGYAVGKAVSDDLKDRWTLELGDSRDLLGPLAERVAPVDAFVHDALQTYSAQLQEFRTIWPHLRSGGVLMSDGVDNPAFVEFAHEVGAEPYLVLAAGNPSAIGLMRKP